MKLRLALLTAVAVALPVSAHAASSSGTGVTEKLDLKATIEFKDGKYAGPVTGKPFGSGKATYTVTVKGNVQTAVYTATFGKKGSISGKAVVTSSPGAAMGDFTYDGTIDVTKGTGDFKGVKAKGQKVTGTAHAGVISLKITGKVNFPVTT